MKLGGRSRPAGEGPDAFSPAGYIKCCICAGSIPRKQYRTACCWTDPNGITCAAHRDCLRDLSEQGLDLPPAA